MGSGICASFKGWSGGAAGGAARGWRGGGAERAFLCGPAQLECWEWAFAQKMNDIEGLLCNCTLPDPNPTLP